MFGYVKPDSAELRVKDYDFYRATYCGICRETGRVTGNASRVTLSYDAVFLALVRMLFIGEEEFSSRMRRCAVHPLKKRNMLNQTPPLPTPRVFSPCCLITRCGTISPTRGERCARLCSLSVRSCPVRDGGRDMRSLIA